MDDGCLVEYQEHNEITINHLLACLSDLGNSSATPSGGQAEQRRRDPKLRSVQPQPAEAAAKPQVGKDGKKLGELTMEEYKRNNGCNMIRHMTSNS